MKTFDWPSLLRVGLHHLKLQPDIFWALTPLEFLIMTGLGGQKTPQMSRADLARLCAKFPDQKTE